MDKEEAMKILKDFHDESAIFSVRTALETLHPELRESEDEKMMHQLYSWMKEFGGAEEYTEKVYTWLKSLIKKQETSYTKRDVDDAYLKGISDTKNELEKQGDSPIKWNKNTEGNKPQVNHSVLMKTFQGISEGEWKGEYWEQYRWAGIVRDSDVLSWMELSDLEKQGKQKPTLRERYKRIANSEWFKKTHEGMSVSDDEKVDNVNKIEPKFKVGDFIVSDYCMGKVIALTDDAYLLDTEQGIPFSCEHNAHLWTIQDAKDGDVLAIDPWSDYPSSFVAIYKKQNGEDFDSYCFVGFDGKFYKGENGHSTEEIHPATKEQRDLLFQKMKEAGYEWDAEKKELKKIEQKTVQETKPFEAEHGKYYYCIKDYFCGGKKQASKGDVVQALRGLPIMGLKDASEYFLPVNFIKCNSAWSEEDENVLEDIEEAIINYWHGDTQDILLDWLNSLKQRIKGE